MRVARCCLPLLLHVLASAGPVMANPGGVAIGWLAGREIEAAVGGDEQSALGTAFRNDFFAARVAAAAVAPGGLAGLRDLIASVEAGKDGYDAVVWSAKVRPPKRPTEMTVAEIRAWIRDTPRQNHAIGRYQFIPKTLERLLARLGIPETALFSPALQDRMADALIEDAGLKAFRAGDIDRAAFMRNLARIWAGLPLETGRSAYHGTAGNRAGMTWEAYEARMQTIFGE